MSGKKPRGRKPAAAIEAPFVAERKEQKRGGQPAGLAAFAAKYPRSKAPKVDKPRKLNKDGTERKRTAQGDANRAAGRRAAQTLDRTNAVSRGGRVYKDAQSNRDARARGRTGASKMELSDRTVAAGSDSAVKKVMQQFPNFRDETRDSRTDDSVSRIDGVFYPLSRQTVLALRAAITKLGDDAKSELASYTRGGSQAERKIAQTAGRFIKDLDVDKSELLAEFNANWRAYWASLSAADKKKYQQQFRARVANFESNSSSNKYGYKGQSDNGLLASWDAIDFSDSAEDSEGAKTESRQGGNSHLKQTTNALGALARANRLVAATLQFKDYYIGQELASGKSDAAILQGIRAIRAENSKFASEAAKWVARAEKKEALKYRGTLKTSKAELARVGVFQ